MTEPIPVADEPQQDDLAPTPAYVQLTQARVPLRDAPDAFTRPDEQGRYPIVVVVVRGGRFSTELLLAAGATAAIAIALAPSPIWQVAGLVLAVLIVLAGSARAIFMPVPQGTQAVMTRGGRVAAVVGPGTRVTNPTIVVSHLVSTREVPFWVSVTGVATSDEVRVAVHVVVSFRIVDPVKFVYNTTAADFDLMCQGSSQTAIRLLVRGVESGRILDLADSESVDLQEAIATLLHPYGIEITRVLIVRVDPPADFLATLESSKLAVLRLSEHDHQFDLDRRIATDKERLAFQQTQQKSQRELERTELLSRVKQLRTEREAERERLRLGLLEERLASYPHAAQWDWESQKLEVARALAGNTHAMLHLGGEGDLTDVIMERTLMDSDGAGLSLGVPAAPAREDAEA